MTLPNDVNWYLTLKYHLKASDEQLKTQLDKIQGIIEHEKEQRITDQTLYFIDDLSVYYGKTWQGRHDAQCLSFTECIGGYSLKYLKIWEKIFDTSHIEIQNDDNRFKIIIKYPMLQEDEELGEME